MKNYFQPGSISQHGQFAHPHPHHTHSHPAVLSDIGAQGPSHLAAPYSSNLGSAVATSMQLNNEDAGNTNYKIEHDLMYYSVSVKKHHDRNLKFS